MHSHMETHHSEIKLKKIIPRSKKRQRKNQTNDSECDDEQMQKKSRPCSNKDGEEDEGNKENESTPLIRDPSTSASSSKNLTQGRVDKLFLQQKSFSGRFKKFFNVNSN